MFGGLTGLFSSDMAIDLGTANTLIHQQGRGVVLDEPSVVAVSAETGGLVAAGTRAKEMLGRTPGAVRAVRPLRAGVISEPDAAEQMLRWFTDRVGMSSVFRPRVVVCIPSDITGVERRAVEEAALRVGARRVFLVEEPMVAAIATSAAGLNRAMPQRTIAPASSSCCALLAPVNTTAPAATATASAIAAASRRPPPSGPVGADGVGFVALELMRPAYVGPVTTPRATRSPHVRRRHARQGPRGPATHPSIRSSAPQ